MKLYGYFVFCLLLSIAPTHLFAQASSSEEKISPVTTTEYSNSFVKLLEAVEMDYYKNKKHWRKGDYDPYTFIRCDVDNDRARLAYKKEKDGDQIEFYLVYFVMIDNNWHFDFNDIVFQAKSQKDGSATTLKHAIKTRNKMYWFPSDMKE